MMLTGTSFRNLDNRRILAIHGSPDNRLVKVEKNLPCERHGKLKCGKCSPKTMAEEYGYLPADWRRVSRKADGQTFVSVYEGDDESHE